MAPGQPYSAGPPGHLYDLTVSENEAKPTLGQEASTNHSRSASGTPSLVSTLNLSLYPSCEGRNRDEHVSAHLRLLPLAIWGKRAAPAASTFSFFSLDGSEQAVLETS